MHNFLIIHKPNVRSSCFHTTSGDGGPSDPSGHSGAACSAQRRLSAGVATVCSRRRGRSGGAPRRRPRARQCATAMGRVTSPCCAVPATPGWGRGPAAEHTAPQQHNRKVGNHTVPTAQTEAPVRLENTSGVGGGNALLFGPEPDFFVYFYFI